MTTAVQDDESAETVASGEVASRAESILNALQQSHDDQASRSSRKARPSGKAGRPYRHNRCSSGTVRCSAMGHVRSAGICDGWCYGFISSGRLRLETHVQIGMTI